MNNSKTLSGLFARARSRVVLSYVIVGLLLAAAVIVAGDDLVRHIAAVESWIGRLGPWGVVAFAALFLIATSLLVPETVLSIMAGALFGLVWGLGAVVAGTLLAASLQYVLSRWLLRETIAKALSSRPSLLAIQRAVVKNELKLQTLLRLTPLNPATMSYMLGAAGVRFATFLLACLALIPSVVIEVYFGFAGKHAVHMAGRDKGALYLHDIVVFSGLAVTVVVVVVVARMAHKAVMEAASNEAQIAAK